MLRPKVCLVAVSAILLLGILTFSQRADSKSYENYRIYRLMTDDQELINRLSVMKYHPENDMEIWNIPRNSSEPIYILSSPEVVGAMKSFLRKYNATAHLISANVGKRIRQLQTMNDQARFVGFLRTGSQRFKHTYYRRYAEIVAHLMQLMDRHSEIKLEVLGHTFEGRPLYGVLVSKDTSKPVIWIDAGIHAREWIAPATALYILEKFTTKSGKKLLDDYQFYIVPVVNPDGYEFSQTVDRFWRKNRAPTSERNCLGTDLNRNFPYQWGVGGGASPRSCDPNYRGLSPSSELETKSLIKKLEILRPQLQLFLSLHSYGQYFLTPFGYSKFHYPQYYEHLIKIGTLAADVIRKYGYIYTVGSSSELLYEASGASDDYVSGELGVPYSFTVELSDKGRHGFLLPPTYIRLVGRHMWSALMIILKQI